MICGRVGSNICDLYMFFGIIQSMVLSDEASLNTPVTDEPVAPPKAPKDKPDEFGLKNEDYLRWSDTEGHNKENKLLDILCKSFEMRKLEPGEVPPKENIPKGTIYVGHTLPRKDWNEKAGDFILWVKTEEENVAIPFDLCTANPNDPKSAEIIQRKVEAEKKGGPFLALIEKWAIDQAWLGGEKGTQKIADELREGLRKAGDRRRSLRVSQNSV